MSNTEVMPELKQILGALIFGANRTLSVKEMRKCLEEVAALHGGPATAYGKVSDADIRAALEELNRKLAEVRSGFVLVEVAGGFKLQSDAPCGRWLRHLLNAGRPNRLSRPALETLAIIAYRQPISRADIEAVRGVAVDHIVKALLEMQLIKIVGRSELPGRPFLYGSTQSFLEHFGLRDLKELAEVDPALFTAAARMGLKQRKPADGPPAGPATEGAAGPADGQPAPAAETTKDPAPASTGSPAPDEPAEEKDDDEDEFDDEDDAEDEFDDEEDDDEGDDDDEEEDKK